MRKAEDVLNVIRERGEKGLPLDDVYRQLYNPTLYLRAYGKLYRNDGAMTEGSTEETVDGMSMAKIRTIIEALRFERYRWTPVRRTQIPKKNGKMRPLGIPTWTDKLLQEVMRSILEAYYEPQFSDLSHGFRPGRGCHTALTTIRRTWKGTKWFIEGDIKGCFDNIDHTVLMSTLREKIHDNRFLRLVENLLKAGYMEYWHYNPTLSGTPQGGVISPILSNIYLDRLDRYVEQTLIPEYTRGDKRQENPVYKSIRGRAYYWKQKGEVEVVKALNQEKYRMPYYDVNDPDYRRLRYTRYADDFLLGFAGPKAEAEEIKEKLRKFLQDELKLEMSEEKTLITHATDEAARFLGYEVVSQHEDMKRDRLGQRSINGVIGLRLPAVVVESRCALYEMEGKPIHRKEMEKNDDLTIVSQYQAEYRGYVQYYQLATNIRWLNKLHWVMQVSLLKTLASKHKTSVNETAKKYKTIVQTPDGPRKCIEVRVEREGKKPLIAQFGGIPLRRKEGAVLHDQTTMRYSPKRTELIQRLLADECEICGSTEQIEVHHIRKLADLKVQGRKEKPGWMKIMSARRRKTLVVCRECHKAIQYGKPIKRPNSE
jgi:group II intron reverse transcriptase/maturase